MQVFLTPAKRDRKIAALREAITVLAGLPVVTPCAQCAFFRADNGYCERWQTIVPPEHRAAGCDQWDEAVPF